MIPEPLTKLGHGAFGLLMALIVLFEPVLTVVGFILFLIYEFDEEWHLHDEAYEEIREALYGFSAGVILLLIKSLALN